MRWRNPPGLLADQPSVSYERSLCAHTLGYSQRKVQMSVKRDSEGDGVLSSDRYIPRVNWLKESNIPMAKWEAIIGVVSFRPVSRTSIQSVIGPFFSEPSSIPSNSQQAAHPSSTQGDFSADIHVTDKVLPQMLVYLP